MTSTGMNYKPNGLYIGGKWLDGTAGKLMESINATTVENLGEVPWAHDEDVNMAVEASKKGFAEWRKVLLAERSICLERLGQRILDHVEELAVIDSYDSGNTVTGMRSDVNASAETLKYFAGLVRELKGRFEHRLPR